MSFRPNKLHWNKAGSFWIVPCAHQIQWRPLLWFSTIKRHFTPVVLYLHNTNLIRCDQQINNSRFVFCAFICSEMAPEKLTHSHWVFFSPPFHARQKRRCANDPCLYELYLFWINKCIYAACLSMKWRQKEANKAKCPLWTSIFFFSQFLPFLLQQSCIYSGAFFRLPSKRG